MNQRRGVILGVLALPLATASQAAVQPKVHVIRMAGMKFTPAQVEARRGDLVEWVNDDIFQHTATAAGMAFDVDLKRGESARTSLSTAGVVDFFCRYHPGMTGRLRVKG